MIAFITQQLFDCCRSQLTLCSAPHAVSGAASGLLSEVCSLATPLISLRPQSPSSHPTLPPCLEGSRPRTRLEGRHLLGYINLRQSGVNEQSDPGFVLNRSQKMKSLSSFYNFSSSVAIFGLVLKRC